MASGLPQRDQGRRALFETELAVLIADPDERHLPAMQNGGNWVMLALDLTSVPAKPS